MRSLLLACLFVPATLSAATAEPLLLRIRPNGSLPEALGSAGPLSDAEIAAQARAAREAVWERSNRRARIAIASVCTGCLPARPPNLSRPEPTHLAPTSAPPSAQTAELSHDPATEGDL